MQRKKPIPIIKVTATGDLDVVKYESAVNMH